MNEAELQSYLNDHIPLTLAMQVSVSRVRADGVELRAPLAPNINHRDTLFGGSASAVATLAAWSLVHTRLLSEGRPSRLVIRRSTMDYERPVAGDFSARSFLEPPADWQRFVDMLDHVGMARIAVAAVLEYDGRPAGRFAGEFVALEKG